MKSYFKVFLIVIILAISIKIYSDSEMLLSGNNSITYLVEKNIRNVSDTVESIDNIIIKVKNGLRTIKRLLDLAN